MACVPLMSNKRRLHFEAAVKLDSLISVPYVNAVFFTKLRLLNNRNTRQYSPRVSVADNSVHFNSSHIFQCKVRINPETNVLESCKLKISVRMESDGGKSFHKIGYVIVDLACFVTTNFVRCRRRYLLKGYDGGRRRAGKRQDNSLLVVSFTCQQLFGNISFRLPPEDLSNCVSTSHSTDIHDPAPTKTENAAILHTPVTTTTTASAVLPPLLAESWNEERAQLRSRRRRKAQEEEEEEAVGEEAEDEGSVEDRPDMPSEKSDEASFPLNELEGPLTHCLTSSSSIEEHISSSGEYISPVSVSIDQDEADESEIFSSPLPQQPPSRFPFVPTPAESVQRIERDGSEGALNSSSSSPSHATSTSTSPPTTPCNIQASANPTSFASSTHPSSPDFSSLPTHSNTTGRGSSGGKGSDKSNADSDAVVGGQFHTCPHMRPSSLLSQHQRKMLGADSGFHFHPLLSTSASSSIGVVDSTAVVMTAEAATNGRCSLSSGFQSHSRNSSFESAGLSRYFPGDLSTTLTGSAGDCQLSVPACKSSSASGSKQHLIDVTRAPHDEVVSQVLRTPAVAQVPTTSLPVSTTATGDAGACPLG